MQITVTVRGEDEAVGEIERSLETAIRAGLADAARVVVNEAKATHPFQNRTGDLEASIHAEENPHGSLAANSLDAAVVADEDYASYVEEKPAYAFLEPAAQRSEDAIARAMQDALDRAR